MLLKNLHLLYNLQKIGNTIQIDIYYVIYTIITKTFYFNRYLNYMATEKTHNVDSINIRRLIIEPVPLFNKNR